MSTPLRRLQAEPTAIGVLVASVLPALVALGVVSVDEQTIGLLVMAANALVGVILRLFVTPTNPPSGSPAEPAAVAE